MNVLITGAGGMLGAETAALFTRRGENVIPYAQHSRNALIGLDLTRPENVPLLFDHAFDVLIYCAAFRAPEFCRLNEHAARQLNALSAIACAKLCAATHRRMIFISSDYVFDGTKQPSRETDLTAPLNVYGQTKVAAEEGILNVLPDAVILRVPLLYGVAASFEQSPLLAFVINHCRAETPCLVNARDIRYPTFTGDVAEGVYFLASAPHLHGIFHLSAAEPFTRYEIAQALCRAWYLDPSKFIPDPAPTLSAARPQHVRLDCSRLRGAHFDMNFMPFEARARTFLAQM